MIDKTYCACSYLTFRYIIDDHADFYEGIHHRGYTLITKSERIPVKTVYDIDRELQKQFGTIAGKKAGLLLSGGMDSACLASYMPGAEAYTFRFLNGSFQRDELERAEVFAQKYHLNLHYVDIDRNTVNEYLDLVIRTKGAPVHSIEPQICQAALQAKKDGVEILVIGDAADYVFGGMDGLLSKDWGYEEFKERITYVRPDEVLTEYCDLDAAFRPYRLPGNKIDFLSLMHEYVDTESYASYNNAFFAAGMPYMDPYEKLKMADPLDFARIRSGESKYLIRALFKLKYPDLLIPSKNPMPRPVDEYFRNWNGPTRKEFRKDIDLSRYTGNQLWLIWCLEHYYDFVENLTR